MDELTSALRYLRTRIDLARHDERGFTAVEWLLIALGVIVIAGIAVAAIKAFVIGETDKLGNS
ncbi:MAG: hypothetical protein ACSLEW_14815 [Nocardioides sp.]